MSRLMRAVSSAALLLTLAAVPAAAHEGDARYRSVVREIVPATDGLSAEVLDHDDSLQLVNRSRRTVVVLDDHGRPYVRLNGDGVVQVNRAVPEPSGEHEAGEHAEEDHASADGWLLASLDGAALAHAGHRHDEPAEPSGAAADRPRWRTLDRSGRYQWHDIRVKYGRSGVPPQVTDTAEETKVKDWRVPIVVGGERGSIAGTLTWVGEPGAGSSFPTAAVVSLAAIALLAVGAVVWVRRRRATGEGAG
jgi:hypothetical protein